MGSTKGNGWIISVILTGPSTVAEIGITDISETGGWLIEPEEAITLIEPLEESIGIV
jgi:hypothetical protein